MGGHFFHYENKPKSKFGVHMVENYPLQVWVEFDDGDTKSSHCMQLTQLRILASAIADYLIGGENGDS